MCSDPNRSLYICEKEILVLVNEISKRKTNYSYFNNFYNHPYVEGKNTRSTTSKEILINFFR